MDLSDDRKDLKSKAEYMTSLGAVADSEYGIPTSCPCGASIIDEVERNAFFSTLPGRRFFTCKNYEDDGLHYCQPWVQGVQEEVQRLVKRVEEAEKVIRGCHFWRCKSKTSRHRWDA